MESTTDSPFVIPIPIPSDTMIGNEEPMGTESVDMEASILNPPPESGSIAITGKEAAMPTLITLAASLPQFQRPFVVISVPKSPFQNGVVSDEEALDKARSCLMEGMHLLNEVSVHTKACSEQLAQHQIIFDEALEGLKQLRTLHEQMEKEAKGLREEVVGLSERNQSLVTDLSQAIGQQEDLKSQYTKKVFQLEIACSRKDTGVDQKVEELRWVIKEGIPIFVRALLDSSDFGVVNATLQTSAIQLGLHQACVDTKEKYPEELKDNNILYSYPDAQRPIMEHFAEMTTYKYSMVSTLGNEELDVGGLKKLLKVMDSSRVDEVASS
ncbi:unnamed protein product [Lactuca virosa]|uniref:DUF641 domain-containing protein n=1 Tax=Lactuca virosa TaxID=75947 RepID=A0AAU9PPU7_9ASTR|nr:unnamed protein product [Lactuca virosa]